MSSPISYVPTYHGIYQQVSLFRWASWGGHCFFCSDVSIHAMALETSHLLQRFPEKSLIAREYRAQQVIFNRQDSALEDESTMSISCIIILRHAIFESKAAMTHPIPLGKVKLIILITVTAANDPKQMRA